MKKFSGSFLPLEVKDTMISANRTIGRVRAKRKVSQELKKKCKMLSRSSQVNTLFDDVLGAVRGFPGIGQIIGHTANIALAGFNFIGKYFKNGVTISQAESGCNGIAFEEIKDKIDEKFNELSKQFNEHSAALEKVRRLAGKILVNIEKNRREMHQGFGEIVEAIKSSDIKKIVGKINKFEDYFESEKEMINNLSGEEYIIKLEQSGFLSFLENSRTSKYESLHNPLFEIIDQNWTIPVNEHDKIALQAMNALYFGSQTYVSVMFFLIKEYSYLADYHYIKNNLKEYNYYFDKIKSSFQDFKHSLIQSRQNSQKPLLDSVIHILQTVLNIGFITLKSDLIEKINFLEQAKKDIEGVELPIILEIPTNSISLSYTFPDIPVPIAGWKTDAEVSYAIQFEENDKLSKISSWSKPFHVGKKACPTLIFSTDPKRRKRLIFRKISGHSPQLIGTAGPYVTEIRDINRDAYNSATNIDTHEAINDVYLLKEAGADLNASFEKGRQLIHVTAETGNFFLALMCLSHLPDLDINVKDKDGYTPLHISAGRGHAGYVEMLLKHKADPNVQTSEDLLTPLHFAAQNGYTLTVTNLLEIASNINCNLQDKNGFSPIHSAVIGGYKIIDIMQKHKKCDGNVKTEAGLTPLHLAAIIDDSKAVLELLGGIFGRRIDVNIGDLNNATPLHFTAISNSSETAKILVGNPKLNLNSQTSDVKWTPLHYAIHFKYSNIANILINTKKIDVNAVSTDGISPLQLAIMNGLEDITEKLILKGASTEILTKNQFTLLHVACANSENIACFLIKKGANITAKTNNNSTPLHLAAYSGQIKTVRLLVEKGVSITELNIEGKSPLHLAVENDHIDVLEFLIKKVAAVDPYFLVRLFYYSAENGYLEAVLHMINNENFDVDVIDKEESKIEGEDETVLGFAICKGIKSNSVELVKYLTGTLNKILCHPVFNAIKYNNLKLLKYFIEELELKADGSDDKAVIPPLFAAADHENPAMLDILLDNGGSVEQEHEGSSVLYFSVSKNKMKSVQHLVSRGADILTKNIDGNTLVHAAVASIPMLTYLLHELHLDINAQNNKGNTVLHLAVVQSHVDTIKFLCDNGIRKMIRNNEFLTAYAVNQKYRIGAVHECIIPEWFRRSIKNEDTDLNHFQRANENKLSNEYINSFINENIRSLPTFKYVENTMLSHHKFLNSPYLPKTITPGAVDVNGGLLLMDVIIRKLTDQNFKTGKEESVSTSKAQAISLVMTDEFEKLLPSLIGVRKTKEADLSQVHRDIFKAIVREKPDDISKIFTSFVKNIKTE